MEVKEDFSFDINLDYFIPDYEGQNPINSPNYKKWFTHKQKKIIDENTLYYNQRTKARKFKRQFLLMDNNIRKIITNCPKCSTHYITILKSYSETKCPFCSNEFSVIRNNQTIFNTFINMDILNIILQFSPNRFKTITRNNVAYYILGYIILYFLGPIFIFLFTYIIMFGKTNSINSTNNHLLLNMLAVLILLIIAIFLCKKLFKYYYIYVIVNALSGLIIRFLFHFDLINFIYSIISII